MSHCIDFNKQSRIFSGITRGVPVVAQLQKKPTINLVNTVVIGKFNPAILTSDFLLTKCGMDFGSPLQERHTEQNLFSEIMYQSCVWTMDLQRFQVQEVGLNRLEEFHSPEYVRQYLKVLPYTPLIMAGINVNLSYIHQNSYNLWKKLSDLNTVMKVVSGHGTASCDVTYGNIVSVSGDPQLTRVLIVFKTQQTAIIRLGITASGMLNEIIVNYNWEIGNVGNNPERLEFLVNNRQNIVKILPSLLEAFMGEQK